MVGTDFFQYGRNYPVYRDTVVRSIQSFDEPGIRVLAFLGSLLYDNPASMFFLASVLAVGLATRTLLKFAVSAGFVLSLYIFSGSWHGSFNVVRQSVAVAIVFAGHSFIVGRKFFKYLMAVALAAAFHVSALPFVLLYWVPRRKLRLWWGIAIVALVFGATMFSGAILQLVASSAEAENTGYLVRQVNPLRTAIAVAPVLLYVVFSSGKDSGTGDWFYRNMVLVHAAIVVLFASSAYLFRYTLFTAIFLPIGLAKLTEFHDGVLRHWVRLFILVLFGLVWYVEVSVSPDLVPFRWIWGSW